MHFHCGTIAEPLQSSASVSRRALRREEGGWFTPQQWPELGLPAPVRKLLAAS